MDPMKVEEFAEKVTVDQAVTGAAALAYVGDRLGLWGELADIGPVTPDELAGRTRLEPRYIGEWLATQAAAGYVTYDPDTGRFALPEEHAAVLAAEDSPVAMSGGFEALAGFWAISDRVAEAFASGEGIAWGDQDERTLRGVARYFAPVYARSLVNEWLPAMDGVVTKLEQGARVLDVGCGYGTSTILMAQAFPSSTFRGLEPDATSRDEAETAAEAAGVADRVSFDTAATGADVGDEWDLVCFFDAFHHVGDPSAAASWAHDRLAGDGALMLVEPLAGDRLEDNLNPVGLTFYGASTLLCVPDALTQDGSVALGGQAGAARISAVLSDAGFATTRTALATDVNLVIEARP